MKIHHRYSKADCEQPEERISKPEDKTMEIIQFKEQKVKRLKKSKRSLRDLWDNTKDQHMHYGIPRRKREKGAWRIFEEIVAENFPNVMKDKNINIQEGQ